MKHVISLSSNVRRTPQDFAKEIVRGALNLKDSPFRESEIYKSMGKYGLCHGHTARALRKRKFNPRLYILTLGSSSTVAHSVLADDRGFVFDRDSEFFVEVNDNVVTYDFKEDGGIRKYQINGAFRVKTFIEKYMNHGTFIQVEPSRSSMTELNRIMYDIDLPRTERKDEFHCTLMTSPTSNYLSFLAERKYVPDFNKEYKAVITGAAILGDEPIKSLVVLLDCPEIDAAHSKMKAAGLRHTFPNLLQHITLATGIKSKLLPFKIKLDALLKESTHVLVLTKESASALKHG